MPLLLPSDTHTHCATTHARQKVTCTGRLIKNTLKNVRYAAEVGSFTLSYINTLIRNQQFVNSLQSPLHRRLQSEHHRRRTLEWFSRYFTRRGVSSEAPYSDCAPLRLFHPKKNTFDTEIDFDKTELIPPNGGDRQSREFIYTLLIYQYNMSRVRRSGGYQRESDYLLAFSCLMYRKLFCVKYGVIFYMKHGTYMRFFHVSLEFLVYWNYNVLQTLRLSGTQPSIYIRKLNLSFFY